MEPPLKDFDMNELIEIKYGFEYGIPRFYACKENLGWTSLKDPERKYIDIKLKVEKNFRAQVNGKQVLVLLGLGPGSNLCVSNLPAIIDSDTLEQLDTNFRFDVTMVQFRELFVIDEAIVLEN